MTKYNPLDYPLTEAELMRLDKVREAVKKNVKIEAKIHKPILDMLDQIINGTLYRER